MVRQIEHRPYSMNNPEGFNYLSSSSPRYVGLEIQKNSYNTPITTGQDSIDHAQFPYVYPYPPSQAMLASSTSSTSPSSTSATQPTGVQVPPQAPPYPSPPQQPRQVYPQVPAYPGYGRRSDPDEDQRSVNVLEHFGIFQSIPNSLNLKFAAIFVLILLVELNSFVNLTTAHPNLEGIFGTNPQVFIGVSIIGLFLGIIFRYINYELQNLKHRATDPNSERKQAERKDRMKSYLTLFFLFAIAIFILIEVIIELINAHIATDARSAAGLFIVDLVNIFIVTIGSYAIFSRNRKLIILSVIFLFLIMLMGIDYGTELPLMVLLSVLTILYVELADATIRMTDYIRKFHGIADEYEQTGRIHQEIDTHMDKLIVQYFINLSFFLGLTLAIMAVLLLVFIVYPYITPVYMNENLELNTIYSILPILMLLFIIFIIYHIITKYAVPYFERARKGESGY